MNILVAPDAIAPELSAYQTSVMLKEALLTVCPRARYQLLPMSDCRIGMADALRHSVGGQIIECRVQGPLGHPVTARYLLLDDGKTAAIEVAEAVGLKQLHGQPNNVLRACSFGAGELILDALKHGVSQIVLGLDETATLDGGTGMMRALGVRFLDIFGNEVGAGAQALQHIEKIDATAITPMLEGVRFDIACEVATCLAGPTGAAIECGEFKGASLDEMLQIDEYLHSFADVLGRDIADRPGAGAAGGVGAVAMAFLVTRMRRGVDIIAEVVDFHNHLASADLVISAQGYATKQQPSTVASGVARLAGQLNKPCVAITPHNCADFPHWIALQSPPDIDVLTSQLADVITTLLPTLE
ncbi:glycerate kinase family protein [Salinibius halmophilus]|uniref:glycerate kinase family protein n=1 Tax=Salinibius halmophilus TaxID=1853216 RepID=UPI00131462D5|nr:glycerate kinase [Salinibius halmophilus]